MLSENLLVIHRARVLILGAKLLLQEEDQSNKQAKTRRWNRILVNSHVARGKGSAAPAAIEGSRPGAYAIPGIVQEEEGTITYSTTNASVPSVMTAEAVDTAEESRWRQEAAGEDPSRARQTASRAL